MKIGLLFAGQAAQYPGMGKSLYEGSGAARKVFDEAGEKIKAWCFSGTVETLKMTRITQPCVFTVSMAAYAAFLEAISNQGQNFQNAVKPAGIAGFSLGEYSALAAAGVFSGIGKGLEIVAARGEFMSLANAGDGTMAAAIGSRKDILSCVDFAREDGVLECVNFNSPMQTVVAGSLDAVGRFSKTARENKIRTFPLEVSAAFHSPMMEDAAEPLKRLLLESDLEAPNLKIYCNVTGGDMFDGRQLKAEEVKAHLADVMARQVKSPVFWQETIENMASNGIGCFIEIGPGTVLSGLVRKTTPKTTALNVEDMESLDKTMKKLLEMHEGGDLAC